MMLAMFNSPQGEGRRFVVDVQAGTNHEQERGQAR